MLVIPEGAPETNHPSMAALRWHNYAVRVDLPVAGEGAEQHDLRPAVARPHTVLRPVQHHRTMPPPREPSLLYISLPVRAVGVHQQQVFTLCPPDTPKAPHDVPLSPHAPKVRSSSKEEDRRCEEETTPPKKNDGNAHRHGSSDCVQPSAPNRARTWPETAPALRGRGAVRFDPPSRRKTGMARSEEPSGNVSSVHHRAKPAK